MKTRNIFSALLGFSLMFSACNSEDVDYAAPSAKTPGVHLRLTGAATGNITSRATVEAEEGEKTVNSLVAVLFDTHEGFYKTVSATCINEATNEYTFIVEKDATYDIWLVANASNKLKGELENIPEGTKMEDENGLNYLESITADQAPDEEGNFLMVSKYSEKITTHITESQSIGEVHMIRLAARFDLLNKAEGVTVTNIEFANRTVKSAVLTPNTMNNASHWFEKKDYSLSVTGDPENGTAWNGKIYTYENHSDAESEQTPMLTITYYEGDDATETKTHEVKLIDPNSTTGKTMPIKRNNLYRIVLTKATKLDFDLQVLDWDDEEAEIKHPEVPLILPKDVQDSLNRQLLVYDLFTEYNVKELDLTNKKVISFFNELDNKPGESYYYSPREIINAGLLDDNVVITEEGSDTQYKLPTIGELKLLCPDKSDNEIEIDGVKWLIRNKVYYRVWPVNPNSRIKFSDEWIEEIINLKNASNFYLANTAVTNDVTEDGFKGQTRLKLGRPASFLTIKGDSVLSEGTTPIAPVYALRFKGTTQYSAYRWENCQLDKNDITQRYLSIKIKALPKNSDITIDDIIDNHSFWAEGYIEIRIPSSSMFGETNSDMFGSGRMMARTYQNSNNYVGTIRSASTYCLIGGCHLSFKIPIRLVKVKKEENESAE